MFNERHDDQSTQLLIAKAFTWMNMTGNLPNAMVVDLVLQTKDSTLSAATYGRSLWRTRI